jgi:hypothetical protein
MRENSIKLVTTDSNPIRTTGEYIHILGAHSIVVVKALRYKPEGRGFETRRGELIFYNLPNLSGRTRPLGLLSL